MRQKKLLELLAGYDRDVRLVLAEVIQIEQEYISQKSPKLNEKIDKVISKVVASDATKVGRARSGGGQQ